MSNNELIVKQAIAWPGVVFLSLGLVILCMVLFNLPSLPISSAALLEKSGGLPILDMRLQYTPAEVQDLLSALGEDGRSSYQLTHLSLDLAFPIFYSLFFASAFIQLGARLEISPWRKHLHAGLALLAGTVDLVENFSIVRLVAAFPEPLPGLVRFAQFATLAKFSLFALNILLLANLLILWMRKKRSQQNHAK